MTSTALHAPPSWRAVAREQLRALGLALRAEILLIVGLLIVFLVAGIVTALRARNDPHFHMGFDYGAPAAIPMSIVALLLPFGVWRSEEPSRRDYHWSMPVNQTEHTLTKVLFGWVWLMLLVAAYLLFLLGLWANAIVVAGEHVQVSAAVWEWFVPFTAATVAYLIGSVVVVGSDHPWRWIMGTVIAFLLIFGFLGATSQHQLMHWETSLLTGYYGLNAAIFGQVNGRYDGPSIARWLSAAALWGVLALAGVWAVAARRLRR